MKLLKFLTPALLILFLFQSCDEEETLDGFIDNSQLSIAVVAKARPELSNFVLALGKTGLDQVLSGNNEFTVLAPTNDAFASFLADNNFGSLDDVPVELLEKVLLNHVFSGRLNSVALPAGYVNTLATSERTGQNLTVFVDKTDGVTINGSSSVVLPNIDTDNGIIHTINSVISTNTVVDLAIGNPNYSTLVAALQRANLVGALQGEDPLTVLAPDNAAFERFLQANNFASLEDVPVSLLTEVLLNHVISGSLQSTDLSTSYANTLATSAASNTPLSIYINTDNGVTFNGVSSVVAANLNANNGVIHAVKEVIGLPSIVTFATADPNFSTLVAALTRSDLTTDFVATLSTANGTAPAPFTVFAPVNSAFAELLEELDLTMLSEIDEPTLNETLTYHVVGGLNVLDVSLTDNFTVPTLGGNITANVTGGATLTDANGRVSRIVATNVQADNGVIHAISKVILP